MAEIPLLVLDPSWNVQKSVDTEVYETVLGSNYKQVASGGDLARVTKWQVSKSGLSLTEKNLLVAELSQYAGADNFQWSPHPNEPVSIYTCVQWTVAEEGKEDGIECWSIEAEFLLDQTGECRQLLQRFDEAEIRAMLAGALSFTERYTRDAQPNLISSAGLVTNAFHDVLGRGGYFPGSSGTSEGQFATIRASLIAYEETGLIGYRELALLCASALEPILYGRPVPTDLNDVWLCNWLFNLSPSFPAKGKYNADYLKYGYFDVVVNFTNGVGVIPNTAALDGARLSDVYSVYPTTARLYYKNVFAPVVFGQPYKVDYWVSNLFLRGQSFRVFPTTASSAGTAPVPTSETLGTIKLTTNFTGQAKVTYAAYDPARTIGANECFEAYPMWRRLDPGEIAFAVDSAWWAWDAYKLLFAHTGDPKWERARIITQNCVTNLSLIPNLTHWYKKEEDEDPFSYPGTQIIKVVNGVAVDTGYTASRVGSGVFKDCLKVDVTSNTQASFPSVELQNFVVNAQITDDVTIRAELAVNTETLAEVVLSTNPDPLNFNDLYTAHWLLPDDNTQLRGRFFIPDEFVKWNKELVWWPTTATTPVYTYDGDGGSMTATREHQNIEVGDKTLRPVVYRLDFEPEGGYAGCGFVLIQKKIRRPPRFYYKSTGETLTLRITDGNGKRWRRNLASTDGVWKKQSFNWLQFTSESDEENPDTESAIQNIELEATTGDATLWIYWIAPDEFSEPQTLPTPVLTYKGSIVFRVAGTAYTFWAGTFRPVGSPSDDLPYNPALVPFTWNIREGTILAWQGAGAVFTGYQDLYHTYAFGLIDRVVDLVDYFSEAQNDYARVCGVSGPFSPVFYRAYWDGAEYVENGYNQFGFSGSDPNTEWTGYQVRPMETISRYLYANPGDVKAGQIATRFLTFYRNHFIQYGTGQPPTNYRRGMYPLTLYHEPHSSALIMTAALYANLAGLSPSVTFGVLARSYEYIKSQYISTGPMAGSFALGQPDFIENGGTWKEWFGFWQAHVVEALSLLLRYKDQIKTPPCGTLI